MRRPGYREAVRWIAHNDDTDWIDDGDPIPSVTACMVMDLFDVDLARLLGDVRRLRDAPRAKKPDVAETSPEDLALLARLWESTNGAVWTPRDGVGQPVIERLAAAGLLRVDGGNVHWTRAGRDLATAVLEAKDRRAAP